MKSPTTEWTSISHWGMFPGPPIAEDFFVFDVSEIAGREYVRWLGVNYHNRSIKWHGGLCSRGLAIGEYDAR